MGTVTGIPKVNSWSFTPSSRKRNQPTPTGGADFLLPQPSASTAGDDTDTRMTEGDPLTAPIRTLCGRRSGAKVRAYTGLRTMSLGQNFKKKSRCFLPSAQVSLLCQPSQVWERPETRVTQEGSEKGDEDRRNVLDHTQRTPCCPPAQEGFISEKQIYATRSVPRCCVKNTGQRTQAHAKP